MNDHFLDVTPEVHDQYLADVNEALALIGRNHPKVNPFYVQAFVIAAEGEPYSVWRWMDGEYVEVTRTELIAEWEATR